MRKNPVYFETDSNGSQLPYLEAIAITFLPDKQSEFLQFVQGNIDFLNSIDPSYKDDILTVDGELNERYKSKIDMISGAYLNTEYLGVFMEGTLTDAHSILIRKAMNYGFDREKMIRYLRNGIGTPAVNGFIPKGLPSFNNLEGYTRPILFRFALDGWCRRILALDPVPRPTGAVGRAEALRHDAFEP